MINMVHSGKYRALRIEYAVLCFRAARGESRRENEGIRLESGTPKGAVRRERAIDGESRSLAENAEKARLRALSLPLNRTSQKTYNTLNEYVRRRKLGRGKRVGRFILSEEGGKPSIQQR